MNTRTSETSLASLSDLILSLDPEEAQLLRLSLVGGLVLVEGSVPSYETKRKIDSLSLAAGVPIQNCLRVVPGIRTFKAQPRATASSPPAVSI
jgi:hypothetical protein